MKLEIEVTDNKLDFFMELIKNFEFVKVKPIKKSKEDFLSELENAVNELNLIKRGEKKGRNIDELLNEL